MSQESQRRKVLVAREDLVNAISSFARKRGSTLYSYLNEILEQAIRAENLGVNLRDALDSYEILKANRNANQVIIPAEVLTAIVNKISEDPATLNTIENLWREAGKWYGEYISIRFRENLKDGEKLLKEIEKLLKEIRWELVDLVIEPEGNGIRVRGVAPQQSVEIMKMISMFIEGVLETFGYRVGRRNIYKGIIDISFTKTTQQP